MNILRSDACVSFDSFRTVIYQKDEWKNLETNEKKEKYHWAEEYGIFLCWSKSLNSNFIYYLEINNIVLNIVNEWTDGKYSAMFFPNIRPLTLSLLTDMYKIGIKNCHWFVLLFCLFTFRLFLLWVIKVHNHFYDSIFFFQFLFKIGGKNVICRNVLF